MTHLALDIGGANLKIADGRQFAASQAFALWREPERLAARLRELLAQAPGSDHLAVTMTGELADCFPSKAAGVRHILDAVLQANEHREVTVYLTDGRLVAPEVARAQPRLAAASNWHALAAFAGRYAPQGSALLLDIGSTTCDIIPLVEGQPRAAGATDTERLLAGELVYTGVERSPVCAIADHVPYRGRSCPLAQELFATARDVYLILQELPETPECTDTADGRPATEAAALARLGRMLCADQEDFQREDAIAVACAIANAQADRITTAARHVVDRLPSAPATVILSGHGEFLAQRVLRELAISVPVVSLTERLGATIARCATAHALGVLAREAATRPSDMPRPTGAGQEPVTE